MQYSVEQIGSIISKRRREKGLTQEALASLLHITPQAISKWENGVGFPDLTLIPRIADILELQPDILFGSGGMSDNIPATFQGLPFITSNEENALYAEKTWDRTENGTIYFTDGSEADLRTGTIVNAGAGEMRIVRKSELCPFEEGNAPGSYSGTFRDIDSLEIDCGFPCRVELRKGEVGETRVEVTGCKQFLSFLEVHAKKQTLLIAVKRMQDGNSGGQNCITVFCGFTEGRVLRAEINGSSDIFVEPSFETEGFTINGSGEIRAGAADVCRVKINGSGSLKLGEASERLYVHINGSGEVSCGSTYNTDIQINGSGWFDCKSASGSMAANIAGSGGLCLAGEVETLAIGISGSCSLDGKHLIAGNANLQVSDGGEITIGRIRGRSVEHLSKNCKLTVLQRG